MIDLSADQARRLALGAQGFGRARPTGRIDRRHVRRVFDHVGLIQIDSVNVLVRSQEMPLYARLGPHPRHLLDAMAADGELFEYWGHEASLIPTPLHRALRWRMDRAQRGETWGGLARLARARPDYVASVLDHVRDHGPITARDLDDGSGSGGPWWGWKDHKMALEYLLWAGHVSARRRGTNFQRVYDLTERMLPPEALAAPSLDEPAAYRDLLTRSIGHLGVATAADAADYFRLHVPTSRGVLREMVTEGTIEPVAVQGWREPGFVLPGVTLPRRIAATTLLSPFDSLVWRRERTERLFGFRYRLEIYTPAPKRIYGYYVLPFLLGDRLVARVDAKADRSRGRLSVLGAFAEPGGHNGQTAAALAAELERLGGWLGLDTVHTPPDARGDLAPLLR